MVIWSYEVVELEKLFKAISEHNPGLAREIDPLLKTQDPNVAMLYSRRTLEVIVTDLCENELKRKRGTEPLKGIIDKLNSEGKVPFNIITSMQGLNSLSSFGTHPKDFDPEQVKPALSNLQIVLKWYMEFSKLRQYIIADQKNENYTDKTTGKSPFIDQVRGRKRILSVKYLLIGMMCLIVISGVVYITSKLSDEPERSIAVLPFRNDTPDDSTKYFMDGMMEELLTRLQSLNDIRVISRTSVEKYRGESESISEIAKELGVNYIVEGSGQKSGTSIRIRVQLIRADKESHLWANSYESKSIDIKEYFKIQSQFAEEIAKELNVVIKPSEKELLKQIPTDNLEAYEAYLKGQFYWQQLTPDALEISLKYFERAKDIDPDYALAYAGICDVWIGRQQLGLTAPEIAGTKAYEAAMKAIEIDSTRAEVHYTLALMYTWGMFDWVLGERSFKKAIELKPNYPEARMYYSHLLNCLGRKDEARIQAETGIKQDPANPLLLSLLSVDYVFFRQYDEAIKIAKEALQLDPNALVAKAAIAYSYFAQGRLRDVISLFNEMYSLIYNPASQFLSDTIGEPKTIFCNAAESLVKHREISYVLPNDIATLYIMGGEYSKALDFLEKGVDERDPNLPYILLVLYDPVRENPRFQSVAKRMNLPYK
jgi:TolB-like protein/cytochrome c-type biogenesis protein CcmH/NrfG